MSKSFTPKRIEIRLTLADGGFAGGENTGLSGVWAVTWRYPSPVCQLKIPATPPYGACLWLIWRL